MCARGLVVLYWQDASGRGGGMRAQGGGARTGWSASEGFVAVSLPPRLDPVVKAERERERQAPGRPAACRRRREPGRRRAGARRGQAGEESQETRLDLLSASLARKTPRLAHTPERMQQKSRDPMASPVPGGPSAAASACWGSIPPPPPESRSSRS